MQEYENPTPQVVESDKSYDSVKQWAEKHRRIEGKPFELTDYVPLIAIYEDEHPFQVHQKPAQVGDSELALNRTFHALDVGAQYFQTGKNGLNVGYLLPTDKAVGDFSKERIAPVKSESEYLKQLFTGYDDITFKQVKDSFAYIRGANSEAGLLSFPCDFLVLDEYDKMPQSNVQLAEKRLRKSTLQFKLYISKPSLPGKGINELLEQSDYREWYTECPCGEWNVIDFFRDVRCDDFIYEDWVMWDRDAIARSKITVNCASCKMPIPDEYRYRRGEWRARYPDRTQIRGYQIPALNFPSVKLEQLCILATSPNPTTIEQFYQSDLGVPYEQKGSRITEAMMLRLSKKLDGGRLPRNARWRNITIGIDVGTWLHYRVSADDERGVRHVIDMGAVRTYEELDRVMAEHHVEFGIIDALPEQHKTEEWAADKPILRAFYPVSVKGKLYKEGKKDGIININRTMAMDAVFGSVSRRLEIWPAGICEDRTVIDHMTAPNRVTYTDDEGQEKIKWVHTKPDHYFHASVYDHVASKYLDGEIPDAAAPGMAERPSQYT